MLNLHEAVLVFFFFSSRRRHTRYWRDWSSDVCSSDLTAWSWRSALSLGGGPLVDDGPGDAGALVVGQADGALGGDPGDEDRKSVGEGKSVDLGGRRIIKKKKSKKQCNTYTTETGILTYSLC